MTLNITLFTALSAYLLLGSPSIGYLLLRVGWPRSRVLEPAYKWGWAVLIGVAFSFFVVAGSLISSLVFRIGFLENAFLISSALLLFGVGLLTARRKFAGKRKLRVSIPKEVAGARFASTKAVNKLMVDDAFVKVKGLRPGKLKAMRQALAKEEEEETEESKGEESSAKEEALAEQPKTSLFRRTAAAQGGAPAIPKPAQPVQAQPEPTRIGTSVKKPAIISKPKAEPLPKAEHSQETKPAPAPEPKPDSQPTTSSAQKPKPVPAPAKAKPAPVEDSRLTENEYERLKEALAKSKEKEAAKDIASKAMPTPQTTAPKPETKPAPAPKPKSKEETGVDIGWENQPDETKQEASATKSKTPEASSDDAQRIEKKGKSLLDKIREATKESGE